MTTVTNLISTSAHDAKITLQHILQSNPEHAATLSLQLLERLQGATGQAMRRQIALRTLRAAARRIAEDDTPDPKGPRVSDIYYTLPVGDLKRLLAEPAEPVTRVGAILTTLLEVRGEECATRRKVLLAALNKAANQLAGVVEFRGIAP